MKVTSHLVTPLIDSRGVRTLGGLDTVQRVRGRLKEEGYTLPFSTLLTLTTYYALIEVVAVMKDGTKMVQGICSMDL